MKILMLLLNMTMVVLQLFSQNYTASDNGSKIHFTINNFGISVGGSFVNLKGKIAFNPASLSASSIIATVDAATVNTGNDSRDKHLRKEDYFDVNKYPLIGFVSSKISNSDKTGNFLMEAKITIKNVTKLVSFPFTATAKGDDYLLEGEFKLNRRDFEVGGSSLLLSDNLTVSLSVLAKKAN